MAEYKYRVRVKGEYGEAEIDSTRESMVECMPYRDSLIRQVLEMYDKLKKTS